MKDIINSTRFLIRTVFLNRFLLGLVIIPIFFLGILIDANLFATDISNPNGFIGSWEALDKSKAFQRDKKIDELHQAIRNSLIEDNVLQQDQAGPNIVLIPSTVTVTQDSEGDIKILGELGNNGDSDACYVKITYTFKDALDEVIGIDSTHVYGSSKWVLGTFSTYIAITDSVLSPSEVGAFQLYTSVDYNQVDSMDYQITFDTKDLDSLKSKIELHGTLNKYEDFVGWLRLSGELVNNGAVKAYFIKFLPTLKNDQGRVIDVGLPAYVDGETIILDSGEITDTALSPGSIGSFEAITTTPYDEVSKVTYKINWKEEAVQSDDPSPPPDDPTPPTLQPSGSGGGGCFISAINGN